MEAKSPKSNALGATGGRRRVGVKESRLGLVRRRPSAVAPDPNLVAKIDDMINHQVTFESETVKQIGNLKDMLAAFSVAVWMQNGGKNEIDSLDKTPNKNSNSNNEIQVTVSSEE